MPQPEDRYIARLTVSGVNHRSDPFATRAEAQAWLDNEVEQARKSGLTLQGKGSITTGRSKADLPVSHPVIESAPGDKSMKNYQEIMQTGGQPAPMPDLVGPITDPISGGFS